jgi:tetratricopeptide (TPR) repeat protein
MRKSESATGRILDKLPRAIHNQRIGIDYRRMVELAKATPPNPPRRWQAAVPGLAILLLVVAAFLPALRGQFIWDDDYNIIKSVPLRTLAGLWRIWFEPGATQQYYPLTHTSFWLDYHLWGLHPMAYHAENILLHAISAVLVWRILGRLGVRGAWLGAALFAVHPVCVESVAWITERKNTLAGVCFLASVLAAIEFWLPAQNPEPERHRPVGAHTKNKLGKRGSLSPQEWPSIENGAAVSAKETEVSKQIFGPWKFYWLALAFYLCALASKTATVGLPGVILLLAWWKRGRFVMKDGILLVPFLALGLGMALITISIEHRLMLIGANAEEWDFSLAQRCLIAGRALWFYLGKLFWPHPLMFVYPRWELETAPWPGYVAVATAVAGFLWLWRNRRGWGRPVLAAAGYFIILLFPVLGFFNVFFFRYSFVCDHFQYLAAIGPLAGAAAGITLGMGRLTKEQPLLKPALGGAVLFVLGGLTWRQTAVYHDLETLWRDSLARNPAAWMAHDNLGTYLSQAGRFEEADTHYRRAIQLRPNDHVACYNLGLESAMQGNLDQAAQYFAKTLAICPGYALAHYQLGNVLTRQGKLDEALREYTTALQANPGLALGHFNLAALLARKGDLDAAIREYSETSRLDPDFASAPFGLGNVLAGKGKLNEAVEAYTRALEIQPAYAAAHAGLGRVLAARGNRDEAILHYRKALEIDPNSVDALVNLGNALVTQGQFEEAVSFYRTALRFDSNSPVIHYNLAVALTRQGKPAEAQAEWAETRRLETEHSIGR